MFKVTKYKPEEFTEELRDVLDDKAEEVLGRPDLSAGSWMLSRRSSVARMW